MFALILIHLSESLWRLTIEKNLKAIVSEVKQKIQKKKRSNNCSTKTNETSTSLKYQ